MSQPSFSDGAWIVWSILHPNTSWVRIGTYTNRADAIEMRDWLKSHYPVGTFVVSDKTIDPNDVF